MAATFSHNRVFLIPLDSRPVCYDLPRRLAAMGGVELSLPSPRLLSVLKEPGDRKALDRWVKNHLFEGDPLIVSLDTIAYGGLIPARVNTEPLSALEARVEKFFTQVRSDCLFGFSAILRIPAYNNAEEEPDYWAKYGRQLYEYSRQRHQAGRADEKGIPAEVLQDFLGRREKNHKLNQSYLARLRRGQLKYLTFCQDDTGAYGLNVQEAQELRSLLAKQRSAAFGHIQTGADEVASCLLARWFVLQRAEQADSGQVPQRPLKIYPLYSAEQGKDVIARFDGLPIQAVVLQAVQACGGELVEKPDAADLWLMVHTPGWKQGDHASNIGAQVDPEQYGVILKTLTKAKKKKIPIALADVAYANGSDPALTQRMIHEGVDFNALYGYAGWNTPGNTIGTALAMGVIRYVAEERDTYDAREFSRLMLIRLADDWLYQSDVRYAIRSMVNGRIPGDDMLNVQMAGGLSLLKERLGLRGEPVQCRFPCNRTFEIEVLPG